MSADESVINVITPVTRLQNLPILDANLKATLKNYRWYQIYDGNHVGAIPADAPPCHYRAVIPGGRWGSRQRNLALDVITEGWVFFLDDDNVMHPGFEDAVGALGDKRGAIFGQIVKGRHIKHSAPPVTVFDLNLGSHPLSILGIGSYDLDDCWLRPACVPTISAIDLAQYVVGHELVGDVRLRDDTYAMDFYWIDEIYRKYPDRFSVVNEYVTCYNLLKK